MLRARVPRVAKTANNYTLTADAGAFTLTGQSADLIKSSVLPADAGAFSVTGQDANLVKSSVLFADIGAFSLTGQAASLIYTPAGSGATPAQIWSYELLPGISAGDMLVALYQSSCPTAAQNAAAVIAAMNATPPGVDVRKVNGYTVDGSGTQADPWGPA